MRTSRERAPPAPRSSSRSGTRTTADATTRAATSRATSGPSAPTTRGAPPHEVLAVAAHLPRSRPPRPLLAELRARAPRRGGGLRHRDDRAPPPDARQPERPAHLHDGSRRAHADASGRDWNLPAPDPPSAARGRAGRDPRPALRRPRLARGGQRLVAARVRGARLAVPPARLAHGGGAADPPAGLDAGEDVLRGPPLPVPGAHGPPATGAEAASAALGRGRGRRRRRPRRAPRRRLALRPGAVAREGARLPRRLPRRVQAPWHAPRLDPAPLRVARADPRRGRGGDPPGLRRWPDAALARATRSGAGSSRGACHGLRARPRRLRRGAAGRLERGLDLRELRAARG